MIACTLLAAIFGLFSCGNRNGTDTPTGIKDNYGYSRPDNCWLNESFILSSEPEMSEIFGDGGKSGLVNENALSLYNDSEHINSREKYLVSLIYGSIDKDNFNISTSLSFTLVNHSQIYTESQCLTVGTPKIYSVKDFYEVKLDMSKPLDGRLTITGEPSDSVIQAMVVIPFELHREGTLYAELKIDNPNMSSSGSYYVGASCTTDVYSDVTVKPNVAIDNFSAKYLTEEAYNQGNFDDSALMSQADFTNGTTNYMIIDFDFYSTEQNDGNRSIYVMVRVPEASIMEASIEEAPTGKIEQSVSDGVTTIYASYTVLKNQNESKKVRMIVRLIPLNEGIANAHVFFSGDENVKTSGNNHSSLKLISGVPSVRYTLNSKGTYYIASSLWQYNSPNVTVLDTYKGLPVKEIKSGIFKGNTTIETVEIYADISSLPASLLEGCTSLVSVTVNDSVTYIQDKCFKNCTSLKSVSANSVERVGVSAFEGCESIDSLTLDNLKMVEARGFYGCKQLSSVAGSLTKIDDEAFRGCSSLTSINIELLTKIEAGAFMDCTFLPFPSLEGVTEIHENAFKNCTSFDKIILPDELTIVKENAFMGASSVKSVHIGANTSFYDTYAGNVFDKSSLEAITVSPLHESFTATNNCLLSSYKPNGEEIGLFILNLGCKSSIVPDNVAVIGSYAFYGCTSITDLTLGDSVEHIYDRAFYGCTALKSLTLSKNLKQIYRYAFSGCWALESIKLDSQVDLIHPYAFENCSSLKKVITSLYKYYYVANGPDTNYSGDSVYIKSYEDMANMLIDNQSKYIIKYEK